MLDAVVVASALGRQDFGGAPAPQPAVGAASSIDACHAFDEGGGVLASLLVGRRHGQCGTGGGQPLGLERRAEQPVVADALEACRQDVLQEARDES